MVVGVGLEWGKSEQPEDQAADLIMGGRAQGKAEFTTLASLLRKTKAPCGKKVPETWDRDILFDILENLEIPDPTEPSGLTEEAHSSLLKVTSPSSLDKNTTENFDLKANMRFPRVHSYLPSWPPDQ